MLLHHHIGGRLRLSALLYYKSVGGFVGCINLSVARERRASWGRIPSIVRYSGAMLCLCYYDSTRKVVKQQNKKNDGSSLYAHFLFPFSILAFERSGGKALIATLIP